jgi:hypothetical protein
VTVIENERIVCQGCGTYDTQATELLRDTIDDLEVAKDDCVKKGRQIKRLQRDRARQVETDSRYGDSVTVLEYWQDVCAPNAREPLSESRVKPVLARLHGGYGVTELLKCADGYARFPYLVRGRRCAFGHETDRFVEAEFIYRKAQNVDRGITLAAAPETINVPPAALAKVPWNKIWHENKRLIEAALKRRYGGGIPSGYGGGEWKWPCPFCQQQNPTPEGEVEPCTLTVYPRVGERIAECNLCGLTDIRLLTAITDVEGLIG